MKKDIKERTFDFSRRIVALCLELDKHSGVGRTLGKQVLRSGTSIGANVEEAHAGQSRADFSSKLSIACKEARETLYWLRLITVSSIISSRRLGPLMGECHEPIAILTTIVRKTQERKNKSE